MRAVAIEVSAQALTRHRVDGLVFDVVGFTNLSHDHLDDYADWRSTSQAKLRLFQPERARRGVVSVDSPTGAAPRRRVARIPADDPSRRLRSTSSADWRVDDPRRERRLHRVPARGPRAAGAS